MGTFQAGAGSWGGDSNSLGGELAIGNAFWSSVCDDSKSPLKDKDKSLLMDIFNPFLSDRRDEGDKFMPPDNSFLYVNQLRNLVREEKSVQEQRKDKFLSNDFVVDNAGPLFPSSWTSGFKVARG